VASGDIVVNMVGQNSLTPAVNQAVASYGALNSSIDAHIARLNGETRAAAAFNQTVREMRQLESVQVRGARGANTAAAGANALAESVTKTQIAMQQGVYAADDFFAAFSTGGFQGGIRGAANNLTMLAGILGTVRTQMIAVAGLAAVQIFPKIAEQVGFANGNVTDFSPQLSGIRGQVGGLRQGFEVQHQVATIGDRVGGLSSLEQAESRILEIERQVNRERDVELRSLKIHRNTLQDILDMQQRGLDVANLADQFGFLVNGQADLKSIKGEILKIDREMRTETERIKALELERKAVVQRLPELAQREAGARRLQAVEADRERDRRRDAMARSLEIQTLRSDLDPRRQSQGRREEIIDEFRRRDSQIMAMGNIDAGQRERMLQQSQSIAVNELTQVDRQRGVGLSARGPATFRAGEADTLRFINQARLGASAKTSETTQLEKLNETNRQMLTAIREQTRKAEQEPVEIVDF
jgi:hypothetical protein